MLDQANALRDLMSRALSDRGAPETCKPAISARTIAVSSGKGGVGKSTVSLNLAVALAQSGAKVCLLDANLGLGNIDLMCGLNGYWNLAHVILGARTVEEILLAGPVGVTLLPGAGELTELDNQHSTVRNDLLRQLESLERVYDYIIFDTGAGVSRAIRRMLQLADLTLIVTTPEPTALADAYATVKGLSGIESTRLCALINRATSQEQAYNIIERLKHTSRVFLDRQIESVGWLEEDSAVSHALWNRIPLVLAAPAAPITRSIQSVARRIRTIADRLEPRGFFSNLASPSPRSHSVPVE